MGTTHTRRGPPKIYIWTGPEADSKISIGDACVSFQTSKALGQPAGSFALKILPRQSDTNQGAAALRSVATLARQVRPNQVVSIGFQEEGGIMLGLVDRVRRTMSFQDQAAFIGLEIIGRDLGKALVVDNLSPAGLQVPDLVAFQEKVAAALGDDHPLLRILPGVWGPTTRDGVPTFTGVGVVEVVEWLLENAASLLIPLFKYSAGGDGLPTNLIDPGLTVTTWHQDQVFADSLSSYEGSVWGFLQQVIDADFYELWLDFIPSGDAFPYVVLMVRPKPFDESALERAPVEEETGLTWDDLRTLVDSEPYLEVDFSEVLSFSLGVSDTDAFSVYMVSAVHELIGNPESQARGLKYPLIDTYNARHFGVRQYNARLALVGGDVFREVDATDEDYTSEVAGAVQEATHRLFNWYWMAPFFEEGSVTIPGRDRARVGDRVRLPWVVPALGDELGLEFYCVEVQNAWAYGGHYTTTLKLTRGHNASTVAAAREIIAADAPASNPDHFVMT